MSTDPKRVFIFIHGYTGGTTDFAELPEVLAREFSATVHTPVLAGHHTKVEDLIGLTTDDLLKEVEPLVAKHTSAGAQVMLVGISFGAQAALYLASKYPVAGVIAISPTHKLKFPLTIPGIGILHYFKRRWKKHFTHLEEQFREVAYYYNEMLTDGFFIARELRRRVQHNAIHITAPILFVSSAYEGLADPKGITALRPHLGSKTVVNRLISTSSHNLFFSKEKDLAITEIVSFMHETQPFGLETPPPEPQVTAIVPAYNEGARIAPVLNALQKAPSIKEILVVDDGSTDNTQEVLAQFPGVTVLRNEHNVGKASSMDRGVASAAHDIIFFCDADLKGFLPEHAEAIIAPVVKGEYDMFIGMRGNFMQRTVRAWGLNSGERALRKEIWEALPRYYKYRYRIEVGLNQYVKRSAPRGLGWKVFNYSQPLKESKYGLVRGSLLRWWMNMDVLLAYFGYFLLRKL